MKHINIIYLILFICFVGCSPPVYSPKSFQSYLFSEKNEIQGSLMTGTSGIDTKLGYAINNNIALISGFSVLNPDANDSIAKHEWKYGEIGGGLYKAVSKHARVESFIGGGYGKIKTSQRYHDVVYDSVSLEIIRYGEIKKIFLQGNCGLTSDNIDCGASTQLSKLFINLESDSTDYTGGIRNSHGYGNYSNIFLEFGIFTRIGWKYVKWETQLSYNRPLDATEDIYWEPFYLGTGLRFDIKKSFFK
jgi:hypothetical protein